jgi:hypothetical protein
MVLLAKALPPVYAEEIEMVLSRGMARQRHLYRVKLYVLRDPA